MYRNIVFDGENFKIGGVKHPTEESARLAELSSTRINVLEIEGTKLNVPETEEGIYKIIFNNGIQSVL